MIEVYEWAIAQFSDISLYGPPTRHVYYLQLYAGETREAMMKADLDRLAYWTNILHTT
jgi:hypothetical protein